MSSISMRTTKHRTMAIVGVLVAIVSSVVIVRTADAAAASALDYAQCANGPVGQTGTDCEGGWINGILQSSNSHYKEDEVTPQRLTVRVSGTGTHTIGLRYQTRKGGASDGNHAYDSLTTWNHTQTTANRCIGITGGPVRSAIGCSATNGDTLTPSEAAIPADPTVVLPFEDKGASVPNPFGGANVDDTGQTFLRQIPGKMVMFGQGTLVSVGVPTHENAQTEGDGYATVVVTFNATAATSTVQLLFGGHIAAPTGARGWKEFKGAANISGGPYHIKWASVDGASIGNRDNQLMGSAIIPLATPAIPTAATTSVTVGGTMTDTAWLPGATTDATGTITFTAYPSLTACNARTGGSSGGTKALTTIARPDGLGGTVNFLGAVSDAVTATSVGTWYWIASYSGDAKNNPVEGTCTDANEQTTVNQATPQISTTASPTTSLTVGQAANISDSASFTGGYSLDGGSVTFSLYFDTNGDSVADCTTGNFVSSSTVTIAGGTASTGNISVTPTQPGTYLFIASYAGDTNNAADAGACGDANESVTVVKANNTGSTVIKLADSITVSGYNPTGNVTFELFGPYAAGDTIDCAGTAVFDSTVALSSGAASTTDHATATERFYSATTAGIYAWKVTYTGDGNNNGGVVSACGVEKATVAYTAANS